MPFNPSVQDRSGEILMQGAQGLAAGISQGLGALTARLEAQKREVQNAKIAEQAFKTNPELLKGTGMSIEQFQGMSAKDKNTTFVGTVQGLANARDSRRAQMQDQEMGERIAQMQQQRQLQEQQRTAMPGMVAEFAKRLGIGGSNGDPSPDQLAAFQSYESNGASGAMPAQAPSMDVLRQFMGAAQSNPNAVDPKMLMQFMSDATREQMADARENARVKAPRNVQLKDFGNGVKGIVSDTGQFQIVPEDSTPQPLMNDDGTPSGMYTVRDRSGTKLVRGPNNGKIDAQTLASLHTSKAKALERISSYKSALQSYTEKPQEFPRPDPNDLRDAQGDFDQINSQLRGVGSSGAATSSSGSRPATSKASNNLNVDASRKNAADAIRRNPAAKAGILQKLRAAGISTEGL